MVVIAKATMNILLIEDNRDLALNLFDYFEAKGHAMDLAEDGLSGLHLAASNQYDVLILDLMLPGIDGLTLCRRLREAGRHTPVLMLTARDSLDDKIAGLEAGADDYVVKPFALREVDARLLVDHGGFADLGQLRERIRRSGWEGRGHRAAGLAYPRHSSP